MRRLRRLWWLLPALLAVILIGFVMWASLTPSPMPEALNALASDAQVQVETRPWLVFRPAEGSPETGLILYPGGRVDPRAYASVARALAENGYLVVIVPMPLNLSFFAPERATAVMQAFPEVDSWVIGGHSLGGAMAARYAYQHPDEVEGLALWAAYPAASDDLSGQDLAVASIYGTLDGLATGDKIAASRPLLPADTRWVAIEGGNHAQFGSYGAQAGDNAATVSREEQQQQIVDTMADFMASVSEPTP
jgi:dienelactone hydrolase